MPSAASPAERATQPAGFSLWRLAWQWAPPVLWMAAILLASNDWLSADNTDGWLRRVIFAIFGPVPVAKLAKFHFLARKAGHLLSYAVLAWLSYRSARASLQDAARPSGGWLTRAALYGLGFTLATASLDELHQAFTSSRTGAFADVLLDMTGAALALALIWIASKRKLKAVAHPKA